MALWYDEIFNDNVRFGLKVKDVLFTGESDYQRVAVVDTFAVGRALLIDDLWMTSEVDEKQYHEMITHPVMVTAPHIERVLIIGGGDGGTAREVLRYPGVKHVDLVEIDGMVVEASKKYLDRIGSAWDDERLHVTIGDGIAWVNDPEVAPYDVIIVDGSDPVGPAEGLFNRAFYQACFDKLKDTGVFVTQSESAMIFLDVHVEMVKMIRGVFGNASPYYRGVFLYSAGPWSWTYASKGGVSHQNVVEERMAFIENQTEIFNRDVHNGIFAIPNYVRRELAE